MNVERNPSKVVYWRLTYTLFCCEQDHPAVVPELDLVEEEDQITHLLRLEEAANAEEILSKSKDRP